MQNKYRNFKKLECQRAFILFTLAVLLVGCSSSSETFECEPGKGVGCRSISTVNKMIDQGHFASSPLLAATLPEPDLTRMTQAQPLTFLEEIVLSDQSLVQRSPEQHIRVWVAPYQDEAGNLHEASFIHSVIQSGFWHVQGNPWGV